MKSVENKIAIVTGAGQGGEDNQLGRAVGHRFGGPGRAVVLGRDTRRSGEIIQMLLADVGIKAAIEVYQGPQWLSQVFREAKYALWHANLAARRYAAKVRRMALGSTVVGSPSRLSAGMRSRSKLY